MLRCDFNPNLELESKPLGMTEEPEWKRSLRYVESFGSLFYYGYKGCNLVGKVAQLEPLNPLAVSTSKIIGPLGRISELAGIIISVEALVREGCEGRLGLNTESAKSILSVTGQGVDLAGWLAQIYDLSGTFQIITALPSIGLAIALLSPTLSLLEHLREEGLKAFTGVECYKTSYQLGMALLSVYLFMTAVTLSMHLQLVLSGTNFFLTHI